MDSLGDFHCSHAVSYPLLQIWFQGNITSSLAGDLVHQLPYPPYPRKAPKQKSKKHKPHIHNAAGFHRRHFLLLFCFLGLGQLFQYDGTALGQIHLEADAAIGLSGCGVDLMPHTAEAAVAVVIGG